MNGPAAAKTAQKTSGHASQESSSSGNGVSRAAPGYGIEFVDRLGAAEAVRGPGVPLPPELQRDSALRYGHSFADVRIHTGARAATAAASLHASAFTLGHDIAFRADRYAPGTPQGHLLLQHELRHVAQQHSAARVSAPEVDPPHSRHEREANRILDRRVETVPVQRIQCAGEDAQFSVGDGLADTAGRAAFGDRVWPFVKAVFEGFVGGLSADVTSGRATSAKSHLSKLLVPWNAAKFYGGYLVGLVLGLVSPIVDLVKGAIGLVKLGASALEWLAKWSPVGVAVSPERQRKISLLGQKFADLTIEFGKALGDFAADPKGTIQKLSGFLDNLMQMALGQAREIGAKGAHAIFDFLEREFYEMGKGIGEVIGTLIAQVLLLVFSEAIGNLIAKGASFLGKAAEFVAGKAVEVFAWVKGLVSEVVSMLRNAVKGALKLFEGLVNKTVEAFDALKALFSEAAASIELGGEKVAAGVGKGVSAPTSNVMESRMVSSGRTSPAKVSDLTPPKVHPSNVAKEAPGARKVSAAAKDAAALQYRENLVKRFPRLQEAELRPIQRNLAEPGLWEESIYTGSGERSWAAKLRDGTGIQLDDIDQAGVVVDTKMRGLRSGLEIPPEFQPDVVAEISGPAKGRSFAAFPESEQAKALKQIRFARENGLTGVRWETNDLALLRDVQRYRSTMLSDAEQKFFNIVLVER